MDLRRRLLQENYMFKKILFQSRAGWFGDSGKNNISEFKRKNNRRNEKEILAALIDEYNKKH